MLSVDGRLSARGKKVKIIDEEALARIRKQARCELCHGVVNSTQPHHILSRARGGRIDLPVNLIGLCQECHDAVHDSETEEADLWARAAAREEHDPEDMRAVVHAVASLPNVPIALEVQEAVADLSGKQRALFREVTEGRL